MPVRQTQGIMRSRHRFEATYTPTGIDACAPNPRNNAFQAPYTVWGFKIIKRWGVVGSGAPRVPPQVPPPGPGNVFSIVGAPILQTGLVWCRATVTTECSRSPLHPARAVQDNVKTIIFNPHVIWVPIRREIHCNHHRDFPKPHLISIRTCES